MYIDGIIRHKMIKLQETPIGAQAVRLYRSAKERSKKDYLEFNLDVTWVLGKLKGGVCEVSGMPLHWGKSGENTHRRPWGPSLDRKDRAKGYTKDNVQLVCWLYNASKGVGTDEDVLKFARQLLIAESARRKKFELDIS